MSLLLDALKRAELEKRRNAQGASAATGGTAPHEGAADLGKGPILSPTSPRPELSPEEPLPRTELPPSGGGNARPAASADERAGAERLFEAKTLPGGSRVWLLGFAAIALAAALGSGLYLWREVSRPPLLAAAPASAPSPARAVVSPAPAAEPPAPQAAATADRSPSGPESVPGRPASPPRPATGSSEPARPPQPPGKNGTPTPPPPSQAGGPGIASEPAAGSRIRIERAVAPSGVDPALAQGYQALQAGDLSAAQGHYWSLLVRDRRNRDALLGLAAIAVKQGDPDTARRYYRQALALNPRDPLAMAGLAALDGPAADPAALESRLKTLLAGQPQPEAAPLHFALGNLYAAQSRWNEAQQAYFQAFKLEPGNADYAYNLAVSLDHLNEVALAGQYYRRALALAGTGPAAAFDPSRVEARLQELGEPTR